MHSLVHYTSKLTLVVAFSSAALFAMNLSNGNDEFTSEGKLKKVIHNYFADSFNIAADDLVIEYPGFPVKIKDLTEFDNVTVLPSQRGARKGIQIVKCAFMRAGQLQETISVKVRVKTFQTVVVNRSRLGRHAILQLDDLELERRETTNVKQAFFKSKEKLPGKRSKRIVQAGEILTDSIIEITPLVSRGSQVELLFRRGALVISLPGIARQDGYEGEFIRVKCLENQKTYNGKIRDSESVIIKL